jgi:hypothetical protein
MEEVTDPALLAQLNGNSPASEDNEVTDPDILRQLNSNSGEYSQKQSQPRQNIGNYLFNDDYDSQGLRGQLNAIPDNIITGVKGGVQNLFHGITPSNVSEFHPQGISQHIGDLLGNIGAFAGGGEALGALGKGIPIVKDVIAAGSKLPGMVKRLGGATTYGAINNPEDRERGATIGLAAGGTGEGLGLLLGKGLPKAAEFLYPKKNANDLAASIYKNYQNAQQASSELYNPVFEKLGENKIFNSPKNSDYSKLGKDVFGTYDYDLKKLHKDFLKEPTLNKAHELQSDIGTEISSIKNENNTYADRNAIKKLTAARNSLKKDINTFLQDKNPDLLQQYKNAANFHRTNVIPYTENKTIGNIVSGQKETITPQSLQKSLQQLSEIKSGKNKEYVLPKDHYLRQALSDLSHRIDRGSAAATAGSLGLGATLGHMLYPGAPGAIIGGAVGSGVGFLGRRYLAPHILDLAANPYVQKTIPKFKVPYDIAMKGLIKSQTGNS